MANSEGADQPLLDSIETDTDLCLFTSEIYLWVNYNTKRNKRTCMCITQTRAALHD